MCVRCVRCVCGCVCVLCLCMSICVGAPGVVVSVDSKRIAVAHINELKMASGSGFVAAMAMSGCEIRQI